MISHVDASSELLWQLTKNQNAFVKTSVNNTRFSSEAGNVTAEHSFKASGACRRRACDAMRLHSNVLRRPDDDDDWTSTTRGRDTHTAIDRCRSRASTGIANATTVDIQELAGSAKAGTVVNGKKCAGTFRSQVGETKLACAGRADLEVRDG